MIQSNISSTHRIGLGDWLKNEYGGFLHLQADEYCTDRRFSIGHERKRDEVSMFAKRSPSRILLAGSIWLIEGQ